MNFIWTIVVFLAMVFGIVALDQDANYLVLL